MMKTKGKSKLMKAQIIREWENDEELGIGAAGRSIISSLHKIPTEWLSGTLLDSLVHTPPLFLISDLGSGSRGRLLF